MSTTVKSLPPMPNECVGIWKREVMYLPGGVEDRTTQVFWAQSRNRFIDLRVPIERSSLVSGRSMNSLDLADLLVLSRQKGFAGTIEVSDSVWSWLRDMDYRPPTGRPDRAAVTIDGDTLVEHGGAFSVIGEEYREVYHRISSGECRRLSLSLMTGGADWCGYGKAYLIMIDDTVFFARERPMILPEAESLQVLVERAWPDRDLISRYLDCEVSMGVRTDYGWTISLSTLPVREGALMLPRMAVALSTDGVLVLGDGDHESTWSIDDTNIGPTDLLNFLA
jgi:hypothetical protein